MTTRHTARTGLLGTLRGIKSSAKSISRKVAATVVAAATVCSIGMMGTGTAHAGNRDWLRPDNTGSCDWDPVGFWVQRCDVWSPAMGRNIPVQIQPAGRGGNAGLYLLDGMRATDYYNAWTHDANAPAAYVDHNITLVMPIGGAGSFYADWDAPANLSSMSSAPVIYKWETFLTSELPAYLQQHFGVDPHNNSIAGLSMGGTSAISLAGNHPDQFRQAMSWSGYLTTTMPGMQTLLRLALLDTGGFNVSAMYGILINPRRFHDDPFWATGGLRNTDVYISAATGLWGPQDAGIPTMQKINGSVLEALSLETTLVWEAKARAEGINVTNHYRPNGVHAWNQWNDELYLTRERVLNVMNAW